MTIDTLTRGRKLRAIPHPPNRLREFRVANGFTQRAIADYLDVKPPTVHEAETRNTKAIGTEKWDSLADLFKVDPRVLRRPLVK